MSSENCALATEAGVMLAEKISDRAVCLIWVITSFSATTNPPSEAKALLKAHRHGDPSCCEVLRNLPGRREKPDDELLGTQVSLQQLHHALALDYGFESWAALKKHVVSPDTATAEPLLPPVPVLQPAVTQCNQI